MSDLPNKPYSPRQKMINLMYLVFIALMALNAPSEVLDGFELVEGGLRTSIDTSSRRNRRMAEEMEVCYRENPVKVEEWAMKAREVRDTSDRLYAYIQDLKVRIVRSADGEDGDVNNIDRKDDTEAAPYILLSPVNGEGAKLREAIDNYRAWLGGFIRDSLKIAMLEASLRTAPPRKAGMAGRSWEEALFEHMPVVAAVTLLTKLQGDVRYAEGEVLSELVNSVDRGDYRVNQITARVIPQSQIVTRGGQYKANIVLSAVDSTKRPAIFVNGSELPSGKKGVYSVAAGVAGAFPVKGYVEMPNSEGDRVRYPFESEYFVAEAGATIAPALMNVLYAGIANPIRVAVPGVPGGNVTATMTNGTLVRKADTWEARPSKVGTEAVITVRARVADGRDVEMARASFRVRALPDPLPYIEYKDPDGNVRKFRGGLIAKRSLMEADGILAAIDDDLLDVRYTVSRFELTFFDSMGNVIPEVAEGTRFSVRQKNHIRNLTRGKRFYITRVVAKGPDGIERIIPAIEVIVN